YSTPAGSFIETSLSAESESPNLFISNQTCLQYTTAGSLIQSSLLARSVNRDQFNKSLPLNSVQMKFFVREILDATGSNEPVEKPDGLTTREGLNLAGSTTIAGRRLALKPNGGAGPRASVAEKEC